MQLTGANLRGEPITYPDTAKSQASDCVLQQQLGKLRNRGHETGVLTVHLTPFHPEVNRRAPATSRETMPVVLGLVHTETRVMVVVKRTATDPALIKDDIPAHEVVHAHRLLEPLRQGLTGNLTGRDRSRRNMSCLRCI